MSLKNILPALIVLLIFSACRKIEIDPDSTGEPVFSVDLLIDGVQKNFVAGENDYYMFTGKSESNGVFEFYGNLEQENCSDDCEPSLRISFRNNSNTASSVLSGSSLGYAEANPSLSLKARVRLEATPFGEPPYEHLWEFENLPSVSGDQVIVDFEDIDVQRIKLTTTDGSGCQNISEREIDLSNVSPFPGNCPNYNFYIEPMVDSMNPANQSFFVFLISASGPPVTVSWDDGLTGFVHHFDIDSFPPEICATVSEFGCEETFCMTFNADVSNPSPVPTFCGTQFTSREELIYVPGDSLQLQTVVVEYTDESGQLFSSELTYQQSSSFFQILDFESYELNEKGKPTIKFETEFSCRLASGTGEFIQLTNGTGVFAVEE